MVINGRTNQEQIAGLIFGTRQPKIWDCRETICSTYIHILYNINAGLIRLHDSAQIIDIFLLLGKWYKTCISAL